MTTKNVSLTDHYADLVDSLVASGKYKNASEVVREGLRLLEQRTTEDERRLQLLKQMSDEGFDQIDQGQGIVLTSSGQLASRIAKLGRTAAKVASGRNSS